MLLCQFVLCGCQDSQGERLIGEDNPPEPCDMGEDFSRYNGRRIGVTSGTVQEKYLSAKIEGAVPAYYENFADMSVALLQGKIDAYIMPYKSAITLMAENPNVTYDPQQLAVDFVGMTFSKDAHGEELKNQFNAYLHKLQDSGRFEELRAIWFGNETDKRSTPDYEMLNDNTNGTIRFCAASTLDPFCFIYENKYRGADMDLMVGFCEEYGYKLEMDIAPVSSLLVGLATSVYDMGGGGIAYTEERAESIFFSEGYFFSPQVFILPKANAVKKGFIESVIDEFNKTFIEEARWKLITSGIGTTFLITICAFILGSALGVVIYVLISSKKKCCNKLGDWYIKIMQGIPTVVILMVLCYVVFAKAHISEVVVAIIGFALILGSETGELYKGGINSVGIGQTEAGLAIGLTKSQTFKGIVLPQAARVILPGYRSAFISLLKSTSIAGYIAVTDLTKMSDIIRSRTYSAFFPLISTAIIYFIASYVIARLFEAVSKEFEPQLENRHIKGVEIHD